MLDNKVLYTKEELAFREEIRAFAEDRIQSLDPEIESGGGLSGAEPVIAARSGAGADAGVGNDPADSETKAYEDARPAVNVEQRTQEADMASIPKINISGEEVGEIAVPEALAEYPCNAALVHACVIAHLAARRQGTASTKTKGEVKGTGSKPYSQKGTGRARAGYIASPLRVGGGVVFGPKPLAYT